MTLYQYQPIGAGGSAVIEAPDRASAVRLLRERGVTPRSLSEVKERRNDARDALLGLGESLVGQEQSAPARPVESRPEISLGSALGRSRVSRADMAGLIRDVSVAMSAGLTLVQSMRVVQRQSRSGNMRAMLDQVVTQVEEGRSLADAAAAYGAPFDELLVGLIRAGEQSGRLLDVLQQAATLLDRELKLRRTLAMGMVYPAVLGVLILGAVIAVVTFVVPRLLAPLAGRLSAAQLPWPTRVVIGVSGFMTSHWMWILAGLAVVLLLARQAMRQPETRLAVDRLVLSTPGVGRLARDVAVARFARTMGTLLSAGLPVLTSLRSARATLGNRAMQAALDEVGEAVQAGKMIAEPMERVGGGTLFPALLTQIVGVGERTGRLGEMFQRAAGVFEERTETSIKVVTTLVPPVLVVFAALVIGFVMAGVLLALLEMQKAIG